MKTALLICMSAIAFAQTPPQWPDPAHHKVLFVTVDQGVKLEVLDWGGTGRPIVLLAGFGNTAHVFDVFGEELSRSGHVYGITRRGFGASSQPDDGYSDQRRADDDLHVLDSLKITRPVLVGHSVAGAELTTLGGQHSDRLAALVYLDALGDPTEDSPEIDALVRSLPALATHNAGPFSTPVDRFPPAELHQPHPLIGIGDAIHAGARKRDYTQIRVPILAFTTSLPPIESQIREYHFTKASDLAVFAKLYAADARIRALRIRNIQSAPGGTRIVTMPGANHYLFITNESEVLREMNAFLKSLN